VSDHKIIQGLNEALAHTKGDKATAREVSVERDPLGPWNRCRDFDEDCPEVECKLTCWLHDPEQGWCPYLRGDTR
jgi:hypothetical protein